MKKFSSLLFAVLLSSSALSVYAADDEQHPGHGKHHTPPQAAIDACKNLAEKASCQFTGRNNETVTGTCAVPPKNDENSSLACRPNRPPKDSQPDAAGK